MLRLVLLSCQRSQQPLHTHFPRNTGVVVSMFTHFFMLCYSCACLIGVTLYCCTAVYVVVLACSLIWNEIGTIRRNLSAAACMDYTSPTTARMSEPRPGASCRAVVGISECNSYTLQRLDSLRRSDFAPYKGARQYDHIYSGAAVQSHPHKAGTTVAKHEKTARNIRAATLGFLTAWHQTHLWNHSCSAHKPPYCNSQSVEPPLHS